MAATQQITLAQPAVGRPSAESDENPPSDPEGLSDDAELYEGNVHLTLREEGGMGLIFSFTQQVRQMPELRLLRLNNNPTGGGGGRTYGLDCASPFRLGRCYCRWKASPRPAPTLKAMFVRST